MTVAELIEQLTGLDGTKEVKFAYNYSDHWHTQVAANIRRVEEGYAKWSGYHSMDKVIESDDDTDEEYEAKMAEAKEVVILS